jgi:hypothetical protein
MNSRNFRLTGIYLVRFVGLLLPQADAAPTDLERPREFLFALRQFGQVSIGKALLNVSFKTWLALGCRSMKENRSCGSAATAATNCQAATRQGPAQTDHEMALGISCVRVWPNAPVDDNGMSLILRRQPKDLQVLAGGAGDGGEALAVGRDGETLDVAGAGGGLRIDFPLLLKSHTLTLPAAPASRRLPSA